MSFRKFDCKSQLDDQRSLFVECFPEVSGMSTSTKDHYFWKFHSKPGAFQALEYCYDLDGEIVGYYASIPYYYVSGEEIFTAGMVCDVMTGIKARGKGVFTKLGIYSTDQFQINGFDLATGFPIRPEVIPGHIKAGWQKTLELPLYGKFLSFNSFFKSKGISFLSPVANLFLKFISLWISVFQKMDKSFSVETFTFENLTNFNEIDSFYKKWQVEIPVALKKDTEFLKWRLGAPFKEYFIFQLKEGLEIVGMAIGCKTIKEGVPCFGIMDISILQSFHSRSHLLLNEIQLKAKELNCELILVMMSNFWYQNYRLLKNFYLETPFKFYFITKLFSDKIKAINVFDEKNWHLMWIDSDDL